MKIKILGGLIIAAMAFVATFNLSVAFDTGTGYNLQLENIQASAWNELPPPGGDSENATLVTKTCANGNTGEVCEFEVDSNCENLEMSCSEDSGTGNVDKDNCMQFGHIYYSTGCYERCSRPGCSFAKWVCD